MSAITVKPLPQLPLTGLPAHKGARLPLAGLRVVEFTHMVMGPTCGMVLADMGAEVIKVEPIDGDRTRRLLGAGSGFFPMFNRNKKSIGRVTALLCATMGLLITAICPEVKARKVTTAARKAFRTH